MIYERPGSRYRLGIRPQMTVRREDGTIKIQHGIQVIFENYPPRFDTEKTAEDIVKREEMTGDNHYLFGDDKEHKKRVKWWNDYLIKFIESHEEYEPDPYAPQRIGRIQRALSAKERLIHGGIDTETGERIPPKIVCQYCDNIKVLENYLQLQDHMAEFHAKEAMKDLAEKHEQRTNKNESSAEAR